MPVSLLDARYDQGIAWTALLRGEERAARALLLAFRGQVEAAVGRSGRRVLSLVAAGLVRAARFRHREELVALARALGVSPGELLLGNLAYELDNAAGCSSFVRDGRPGPLHARNLDWNFPGRLLRDHVAVVRVRGAPRGDYALVTWPGLIGALTAVAPARFSLAVNYVRHASQSRPVKFLRRAAGGHWAVTWAVRRALEEARDFGEAVAFLSEVPLLAPALLSVAGARPGEGLVIERTATGHAHRRMEGGVVGVTNHYLTEGHRGENVDLSAEDTLERFAALRSAPLARVADVGAALGLLSRPDILRDRTQVQVAMCAATGALAVQVPGEPAVGVPLGAGAPGWPLPGGDG